MTIFHWIEGRLTEGNPTQYGPVFNPSLGTEVKQVVFASPQDVDLAVKAANNALPQWREMSHSKRVQIMFRFKSLIEQHLDELAHLIATEHGKTIEDAKAEISRGKEVVELACGAPSFLQGAYSENVGAGVDTYSLRQPVGICAGITPFNFPAMLGLWMFPVAIMCGNTFIWKPSEKDPSVSIRLAELCKEAGLPDGVLNVVHGGQETVDCLLSHPHIAAISFVGSTPIARAIYQKATVHGKRVQAFAGAKNHGIVLEDANLDDVANAITGAAYGSAGERCMAIPVVVAVGNSVADQLVPKIIEKIKTLKVGLSHDHQADIGPLVTKAHWERVNQYVEWGVQEGAQLVLDHRKVNVAGGENGFFMGPCLFDHVTPQMKIYQDEIFGPVLCVVRVPDWETALDLVNRNPYGNGTSLFTTHGAFARDFAHRVQVGMVGINIPIPVPVAYHSFGGWKQSFFGDNPIYGEEGFRFYTRLKTITMRWENEKGIEYRIPTTS